MWLFYSLAAEARFQEGPFGQVRSMQCKYTPPGNEESTCDTELLNTYIGTYIPMYAYIHSSGICTIHIHTSLFLRTVLLYLVQYTKSIACLWSRRHYYSLLLLAL